MPAAARALVSKKGRIIGYGQGPMFEKIKPEPGGESHCGSGEALISPSSTKAHHRLKERAAR
jgi:hypothetical protein